jgi:hypothetical protein
LLVTLPASHGKPRLARRCDVTTEQRDELETWAGADGGELIRAALDEIDAQADELRLLRKAVNRKEKAGERIDALIEYRTKYGSKP